MSCGVATVGDGNSFGEDALNAVPLRPGAAFLVSGHTTGISVFVGRQTAPRTSGPPDDHLRRGTFTKRRPSMATAASASLIQRMRTEGDRRQQVDSLPRDRPEKIEYDRKRLGRVDK
jgi:hypothetical protein